jgi:hypothetical protein
MCQGRKLRRTVCKCCGRGVNYEILGTWEVYKKGYKCRGGRAACAIFDYRDEVESKHRCAACLAKTVLGFNPGHQYIGGDIHYGSDGSARRYNSNVSLGSLK